MVPSAPPPRVPMHATDVAVVQLAVLQSASAITLVTVASVGPKLMPVRVTLLVFEPTLCGAAAVITGAAKQIALHRSVFVRMKHV